MSNKPVNLINDSLSIHKPFKKSAYQQFQQKDYQRILDEKDQKIRKLEYKIEKLTKQKQQIYGQTGQGNIQNFYKQKLEEQIKNNQQAIGLLVELSHKMKKIIDLMKLPADLSQSNSDVKNMIQMLGGAQQSYSQQQQQDKQNLQAIQLQIKKRIQQLELVCDNYHRNYTKIQKQNTNIQIKLKQIRKQSLQQVKTLQRQIKQQRQSKQHLEILLDKSQKLKQEVLEGIANCLDYKIRKQVEKMNRQDLIGYIKKLTYKIGQIQAAKAEVIRQNNKIKTSDLEKYKKMLNQVREVKEMSRMGHSLL